MRTLFDKTRIGQIELKNRLIRSATGEALAEGAARAGAALHEG
jgi:2,4-dienoyl-CoA reductase-like NADH-dependent reductase (Old Yellow Enzyme family)